MTKAVCDECYSTMDRRTPFQVMAEELDRRRSVRNRKIEDRFQELAHKEALNTITKKEYAKLKRYRQLRRNGRAKPPANARFYWELRCATKTLTMFERKQQGAKYSWPKYSPTPSAVERGTYGVRLKANA